MPGGIRGQQIKDDSLTGADIDESTLVLPFITDADEDTTVHCEGSGDEDKIRFDTAGSERMIITADGSVGIGKTDPANPLHVYGNLNGSYVAIIDNDQNTNGHVLKLLTDGNGTGSRLLEMEDGDGDVIFRARADGRFGFGPDGVDSMGAGTFVVGIDNSSHTSDIAISARLQHLGDGDTYLDFPKNDSVNIVVGGDSALKLDNSVANPKIQLNNTNADIDVQIMADDGNVILHTDAATNMVGIGTSSPAVKLQITGGTDASLSGGSGYLVLGGEGSNNVVIDNNEIIARNNGANSILYLNATGGEVRLGNVTGDAGLTIDSSGNVGIGTPTPGVLLDVRGLDTEINIQGDAVWGEDGRAALNIMGRRGAIDVPMARIDMPLGATGNAGAQIATFNTVANTTVNGANLVFATAPDSVTGLVARLEISGSGQVEISGSLGVKGVSWFTGPASLNTGQRVEFLADAAAPGLTQSRNGAFWQRSVASNGDASTTLEATNELYDMLGPAGWTTHMYHYGVNATPASTSGNVRRYTDNSSANNFTGQHNVLPAEGTGIVENLVEHVGLIVRSTGEYCRFDEPSLSWISGSNSITIAEALPRVELTTTANDKSVFGVISNMPNEYLVSTENGEYEQDQDGIAKGFGNVYQEQVRINSIGEGAIWIVNAAGNLENGDYITTSALPGYGTKQADDLLHNHTVAKITQDCSFDLNSSAYKCEEFEFSGETYRKAFVGCTYHCG